MLELFIVTASKKNFSQAAKALSVTQSTLSQQIRRLEMELGYPLFLRQKGQRNVALTQEGGKFLELAVKMQDLWKAGLAIGRMKGTTELRISIMESVMTYSIPNLIPTFTEKYPSIHLSIRNYYSKDVFLHLECGELDLAIIRTPASLPSVTVTPLFADPWVVVCGKDDYDFPPELHPSQLDPSKQIFLLGSNDLDWSRQWFPQQIDTAFISHTLAVVNAATFREGKWAILPRTIAQGMTRTYGTASYDLLDGPPHRVIYLALPAGRQSEAVNQFISCLLDQLRNIEGITLLF